MNTDRQKGFDEACDALRRKIESEQSFDPHKRSHANWEIIKYIDSIQAGGPRG